MSKIDILDKPIERIQETCAMMGVADQFDRALPDLETFLEGEVAKYLAWIRGDEGQKLVKDVGYYPLLKNLRE